MKTNPLLKKLLAPTGMAMAEVMMAAGLLGVLAVATTKLTSNMQKSAKGVELKFEYQSLHADIRTMLSNTVAASNTFVGIDLTACNGAMTAAAPAACHVIAIKDGTATPGATRWQAGAYPGSNGATAGATAVQNLVEIDSAWLSNWVENASGNTGDVTLNIRYENLGFGERAVGQRFVIKSIVINVKVDGNDVITEATASASGGNTGPWLTIMPSMDGIFYGDGGVLIGSTGLVNSAPSLNVGSNNKATGVNSVTFGDNCVASGDHSFCHGSEGVASGALSVAIGSGFWTNYPTQATNAGSVAIGVGAKSTGINSLAMGGKWATASGQESVAIGRSNLAQAPYSFAAGYDSWATVDHAIVFGNTSRAQANRAMALGNEVQANGIRSVAIGNYVTAQAAGSWAIGDSTMGTVTNSIANSFKARFDGGYALHTDAAAGDGESVLIDGSGQVGIGVAPSTNRLEVANGTTKLEQEDEQFPSYVNNWETYNGLDLKFFKDSTGVVHMNGGVCNTNGAPGDGINNCGTPASHPTGYKSNGGNRFALGGGTVATNNVGIQAFTLPAGYRPNRILIFNCTHRYSVYPHPEQCSVWVNPGGAVHIYTSHAEFYPMINLSFRAY